MKREEKEKLIKEQVWYHSIEIEKGLVTPGRLPLVVLEDYLEEMKLPADLSGLSVLDIGACDGFYSFAAEKRGADRVVGYEKRTDTRGITRAVKMLNSKVEVVKGDVYDLSPGIHGTFDIVLFLGLFYHLRYPLLALDRIFSVTRQYMIMETHYLDDNFVLPGGAKVPLKEIDARLNDVSLYQFYRYDEVNPGDYSNWFSPNKKALETSLWSAGFEPECVHSAGDRIIFKGKKRPGSPEYISVQNPGSQTRIELETVKKSKPTVLKKMSGKSDKEKSIFFITLHKAASSLFSGYALKKAEGFKHIDYEGEIFNGKENVDIRFLDEGYVYGAIRLIANPQGDTYPLVEKIMAKGFIKDKQCVFLVRDPRDIIVSAYYSFGYSHSLSPDEKIREKQIKGMQHIQNQGIDEFALWNARQVLKRFEIMARLIEECENYILLKYKDMIDDFNAFYDRLSEFLPFEQSVKEQLYTLTRPEEKEDITKHKRSGKVGGYKEKWKPETIREIDNRLEDILIRFDYRPRRGIYQE